MPVDIFGRSVTATSFQAASLISLIGTKVSRSGDNLSGDLSLDGHRLKQIPHEPTDTTDGAAASFVIAGRHRCKGRRGSPIWSPDDDR